MKIIRYALILGIGAFLLPAPPPHSANGLDDDSRQLAVGDLFMAASDAVGDVSMFCQRQRDVCTAAATLARQLEVRAKYSIRLVYEWSRQPDVQARMPQPMPERLPVRIVHGKELITGSTPQKATRAKTNSSSGTLTIEDLIPDWRGPIRPGQG